MAINWRTFAREFFYYDRELQSWTVIAGIPHFDQRKGAWLYNWGRDTMIALPGLSMATKEIGLFRVILLSYLRFVKYGLLPNFIGNGQEPRYNSIDATLWLFHALYKYWNQTHDKEFFNQIIIRNNKETFVSDILREIILSWFKGIEWTDFYSEDNQKHSMILNLSIDTDGLIVAGNEKSQLTWMDARPNNAMPITSRHGKAIEIQALWYETWDFLEKLAQEQCILFSKQELYPWSELVRDDLEETLWSSQFCYQMKMKIKSSMQSFWNESNSCLYDTIDGDRNQGQQIRPNQLFAIATGAFDNIKQCESIIKTVIDELLTPFGLRTLSEHDAQYHAVHTDEYSYHQGTIWPWLIGVFVESSIKVFGKEKTYNILQEVHFFSEMERIINTVHSIPEIFDGNSQCGALWNTKGCTKQAWSVASVFEVFHQF